MAGLYIHIPFCRQACHYCDFHFSTTKKLFLPVYKALLLELEQRKTEFAAGTVFETIYLGGGTPSLLGAAEVQQLLDTVRLHYTVAPDAEITLEANPDDLTPEYLRALYAAGINRLSIGIQSFRDEDLQLMNRAHTAADAARVVEDAQAAGFSNITIDLIYGIPGLSNAAWDENISRALALNVPHISAYCLTVEPKTALAHFVSEGKINPVDDEAASAQFMHLLQRLRENGFVQYEISNFGRPGYFSRHNSSYWKGVPYIGIGPSAHSFDGTNRRWNVSNNPQYAAALRLNEPYSETEQLTHAQRYNEYVLISLRTMWGCAATELRARFGEELLAHFENEAAPFLASGDLLFHEGVYTLADKGKLYADHIASELFRITGS